MCTWSPPVPVVSCPCLPLSKFVDSFRLYEGYPPQHKTERILPTGTLELAINLGQNELRFYDAERPENCSRLSGAIVSGASGRGFAPAEEAFIIGVHFKPGGAFPLGTAPVNGQDAVTVAEPVA